MPQAGPDYFAPDVEVLRLGVAANGDRFDRVERPMHSLLCWGQPLRGAQSETMEPLMSVCFNRGKEASGKRSLKPEALLLTRSSVRRWQQARRVRSSMLVSLTSSLRSTVGAATEEEEALTMSNAPELRKGQAGCRRLGHGALGDHQALDRWPAPALNVPDRCERRP